MKYSMLLSRTLIRLRTMSHKKYRMAIDWRTAMQPHNPMLKTPKPQPKKKMLKILFSGLVTMFRRLLIECLLRRCPARKRAIDMRVR